jgi:hypothetical protein
MSDSTDAWRRVKRSAEQHFACLGDAYYIPDDPKERIGPVPSELVHQAEDVIVDRRVSSTCRKRTAGSTSSTTNMTKE